MLVFFNDLQTLLTAAEAYYHLGYAVIPLLGDLDPTRPKVAARPWSAYQSRPATLTELHEWFSPTGNAAALGIVTGRVSRLVVLDFDSADCFADFRRQCPDLIETRTVQSAGRALPHLYFHLPSHLHLASHKRAGVDLLSDGRYVVAPPTTINGQPYRITRGGMPRPLTQHDITRILAFLTSSALNPTPITSVGKNRPLSPTIDSTPLSTQWRGVGGEDCFASSPLSVQRRETGDEVLAPLSVQRRVVGGEVPTPLSTQWRGAGGEDLPTPASSSSPSVPLSTQWRGVGGEDSIASSPVFGGGLGRGLSPSRTDLHALYHYWLTRGGRNEALFRTALYARDHGWDQTQTRRALTTLHVTRAAQHTNEAAHLRQREAYATIRSAFSRPPRPSPNTPTFFASAPLSMQWRGVGGEDKKKGLIPNSIREALLQRKHTCVLRTLEGLLQSGFRPDQGFTADQAIETLKGIVGRDSVYNALNALSPTGQPFFPQRPPSALPQASKEAATGTTQLKTKKCFFVTEKKSGIKKRGPKHRHFKMPTIRHLYKLLGVKPSGSDPLTREDLTSARQTRMALHRELIKRRPADYSRRWLANRIGVTRRTLDTYNHLIPIHSRPTYHEKILSWDNINTLPADEALAGAHIETLMGKKYPALRAVAAHLLAKNAYIRLKTRAANYYWYGTDEPPTPVRPIPYSTTPSPALTPLSVQRRGCERPSERGGEVPTPLSMQWRGAGGEVPTPSPVFAIDSINTINPSAPQQSRSRGFILRQTQPSSTIQPRPTPVFDGKAENLSPRRFRLPLPDAQQEALAQTIYTRVNQRTGDTNRHLSLSNARRLVLTHHPAHINAALHRLQQRPDLTNPTGFFVTVLRSNARMPQE